MHNRGLKAALVAAAALGSSSAMGETYRLAKADDYGDIMPIRRRKERLVGGRKGKRHADRQRKRPNMNLVSRRVRRKHRRARRAA